MQLPCSLAREALPPLSLALDGATLQVDSSAYTFASGASKCQLTLLPTSLPAPHSDIYLIGQLLLKHFYTVFDFEKQRVLLGASLNSQESRIHGGADKVIVS